jgi:hypothetical protein
VIYFVRSGHAGPIKIGCSCNPDERIKSLCTATSWPIERMALMEGGPFLERQLHKRFAHLRIRGEWYDPGPDLIDFVQREGEPWTAVESVPEDVWCDPNPVEDKPRRPPGRPRLADPLRKSAKVDLRTTAAYKAWLDRLLRWESMTFSRWLRAVAAERAKKVGFKEPPPEG